MTSKENNALKVMFPEEEVELFGGKIAKIRPLSLKDIPKVIESFKVVMKIASETEDMADVATLAITELLDLIPYCTNCKPEEIPMRNIPDILDLIVRQNLTEASVGKWKTLISTFADLLGDQGITDMLVNPGILPKVSKKS